MAYSNSNSSGSAAAAAGSATQRQEAETEGYALIDLSAIKGLYIDVKGKKLSNSKRYYQNPTASGKKLLFANCTINNISFLFSGVQEVSFYSCNIESCTFRFKSREDFALGLGLQLDLILDRCTVDQKSFRSLERGTGFRFWTITHCDLRHCDISKISIVRDSKDKPLRGSHFSHIAHLPPNCSYEGIIIDFDLSEHKEELHLNSDRIPKDEDKAFFKKNIDWMIAFHLVEKHLKSCSVLSPLEMQSRKQCVEALLALEEGCDRENIDDILNQWKEGGSKLLPSSVPKKTETRTRYQTAFQQAHHSKSEPAGEAETKEG